MPAPAAGGRRHHLAAASESFGLGLTRLLALNVRHNVFVSPLSAQMALAMAAYGARGTTQRAMLDTIGLSDLGADQSASEASALIDRLTSILPGRGRLHSIAPAHPT